MLIPGSGLNFFGLDIGLFVWDSNKEAGSENQGQKAKKNQITRCHIQENPNIICRQCESIK
jgi:hypothetical protein